MTHTRWKMGVNFVQRVSGGDMAAETSYIAPRKDPVLVPIQFIAEEFSVHFSLQP